MHRKQRVKEQEIPYAPALGVDIRTDSLTILHGRLGLFQENLAEGKSSKERQPKSCWFIFSSTPWAKLLNSASSTETALISLSRAVAARSAFFGKGNSLSRPEFPICLVLHNGAGRR
jgi:hypothetical protein